MHRHGYKGRKLGRKRDERRNLVKGLATSLFEEGSITTTLQKAKTVVPYAERLMTHAKKGTLAGKRTVFAGVTTKEAAHALIDEWAVELTDRDSGHFRIIKQGHRRGDDALMATVSFVEPKAKSTNKSTTKAKETA
jgi:large subunit ribosomal protein L17